MIPMVQGSLSSLLFFPFLLLEFLSLNSDDGQEGDRPSFHAFVYRRIWANGWMDDGVLDTGNGMGKELFAPRLNSNSDGIFTSQHLSSVIITS